MVHLGLEKFVNVFAKSFCVYALLAVSKYTNEQ